MLCRRCFAEDTLPRILWRCQKPEAELAFPLNGDMDSSGSITIGDAISVMRLVLGILYFTVNF